MSDLYACRLCGVATDQRLQRRETRLNIGTPTPSKDFDTGLCDDCVGLLPDEPGVSLRVVARLLGCHPGDPFFETPLGESDTLDGLLWDDPRVIDGGRARQPQRKAWGHVTGEQRRAWKAMRVKAVADRMRADAESAVAPEPEPPPDGQDACLICGRRTSMVWMGPVSGGYTLSGNASTVSGYLCDVDGDLMQSVGALGAPLYERSVMLAHGLEWSEAIRLNNLRPYAAETDVEPSDLPWAWIDLAPIVPEPDLTLRVAALEETVAWLEAALGVTVA